MSAASSVNSPLTQATAAAQNTAAVHPKLQVWGYVVAPIPTSVRLSVTNASVWEGEGGEVRPPRQGTELSNALHNSVVWCRSHCNCTIEALRKVDHCMISSFLKPVLETIHFNMGARRESPPHRHPLSCRRGSTAVMACLCVVVLLPQWKALGSPMAIEVS